MVALYWYVGKLKTNFLKKITIIANGIYIYYWLNDQILKAISQVQTI